MSEYVSSVGVENQHFKAPSQRFSDRFQERYRLSPQQEHAPALSGLALEVDEIKKRGEQEMYLLPDTGFHVRTQVDLLIENRKKGIPVFQSLQQLEEDIQGFKVEYLVELPVFAIRLEKKMFEGRERIVGAYYDGKPLSDTASADEREGVVKRSTQEVEQRLLSAKPGTVVVWTSPDGWSGYQVKNNNLKAENMHDISYGQADRIEYPDSQTYVYKVEDDGSISGFTLKSHMNLPQNQQLLKDLGAPEDAFLTPVDTKTDIKRTVGTVLTIDSESKESAMSIAQKIMQIMDTPVAYMDSAKRPRTFHEMQSILKNPEFLWTLDEQFKKCVDPLKVYIKDKMNDFDSEARHDIETALGLTILKLTSEVRMPSRQANLKPGEIVSLDYIHENRHAFDPRAALTELKAIGGCAGGGNDKGKTKTIIESVAARIGIKKMDPHAPDESYGFDETGNCQSCGKEDVPVGPCKLCQPCDSKVKLEQMLNPFKDAA